MPMGWRSARTKMRSKIKITYTGFDEKQGGRVNAKTAYPWVDKKNQTPVSCYILKDLI